MIRSLEEFATRGRAAQKSADEIIAAAKAVLHAIKADTLVMETNVPMPCPLCGVTVIGKHRCERKGQQ
jgi:predicted RNA-binding Zn-ribbon protein involved in translation (DUF1610 family)